MLTVTALLAGLMGCGDDDGAPPFDGGVDASVERDAGGTPDGGANDAGGGPVACDLRDDDPCPGEAQCVGYTEFRDPVIGRPDNIQRGFACREGVRVSAGLPCSWTRLTDRDGWMREIDDCAEGLWCFDVGETSPFCRPYCGPDLGACDAGSVCVSNGDGIERGYGGCALEASFDGCDAVLQTGCADGSACFLYRGLLDAQLGVGDCYPTDGLPPHYDFVANIGRNCQFTECPAGAVCVQEPGAEWECRKLCDASGASMSMVMSPDGTPWGDCPPSAATCVPLLSDTPTPAGYCD